MGYRDDMKAIADCQRIKRNGGTAKFSIASITTMSINLPDAKKRLTGEEFDQVYALFKRLRKCKSKIELDIDGYHDLAARIVLMFDNIAPYEKYSGMDEIEGKLLITGIREIYGDDPGFADDIVKEITHGGEGGNKQKKRWGVWFLCAVLVVAVCVLGCLLIQKQEKLTTTKKRVDELNEVVDKYATNSIIDDAQAFIDSSEAYEESLLSRLRLAELGDTPSAKEKLRFWAEVIYIPEYDEFTQEKKNLRSSMLSMASISSSFYVASTQSDKYHHTSCARAKEIRQENRAYYTTIADAETDGKTPCSVCFS